MLILYLILAIILLFVIFWIAPGIVCYRSIFGRHKVLQLDDEKLHKPAIEPFKKRMLRDWHYLRDRGFERVKVTATDGVTLCGDRYDRAADRTVLMVHGFNADPYVNLVAPARWFYDQGYNVLVIYQRAREILRRDDRQRVLLYGTSMGGSTLAYLSDTLTEERVPCMMIDCGFISAENQLYSDAKRMHLPRLLIPYIRWLCQKEQKIDIREKTTEHLRYAKKPILFFHGTADSTVSLDEGRKNYESCSAEKAFVVVEGAGHTTAFCTGELQVTAAMTDFLQTYFHE